ncbi:unnamed protein product [Schistosoma intercalatum]|nr:unnamed protein product [Schistosoma intercalatum]
MRLWTVPNFLPIRISAGDFCCGSISLGVVRLTNKKFCSVSTGVPSPFDFIRALLNASTNLSACPFDCGW